MNQPQHYMSYLLRMWRSEGDRVAWRASLESPLTGERQGFASLKDLFAFLQGQADSPAGQDSETNDGHKQADEK